MKIGTGWLATLLLLGLMGTVAACGGGGEPAADTAQAPAAAATDDDAAPAADGTRTWTNDPARLVDQKAANFIPFTFRYPGSWRVVEDGSQMDAESPNFVKVENSTSDNITIENFAVGWYAGTGAAEVIALIEPQFASSFPNYAKVGDRTWTIDGIESPGILFQARVDAPGGPVPFFGRIMAVPVDASRGLMIVLFASDRADGVTGPEDVGEEGEMPVILESFDIPR
jgi:hypothetical protein